MCEGLKSRRKASNPEKISNFVGRVKGLKVFVGNFTYECDFVVLEDTTSVIDHYLGGMVLGKLFVEKSGLVYDKDEGTVTFGNGDDSDQEKTHYSDSLNLDSQIGETRVCLRHNGGGLILYQAYDNLYAMTGRKAHLLGQANPKCRELGWHLEEIHLTWAQLRKKRTRLQLYTKVEEEKVTPTLETASQPLVTASEFQNDGVRNFETATGLNRHSETLEDSAKRRWSAQGGFNLNDEVGGYEEEIREERPIGRGRAKNTASSSSSRSSTSSVAGGGVVELVADKWKSINSAS
ncbi:hypothetical protein Tco_1417326 [Tanacetum coccineum]